MEKISDASRAFKCSNGEQVTLKFTNHNTDLRVSYRFDDEATPRVVQGDSLTFPLTEPFRILRVFFHFINEAGTGGSYDIELSGSEGGAFQDEPSVLQAGDFVPFRRYAFIH